MTTQVRGGTAIVRKEQHLGRLVARKIARSVKQRELLITESDVLRAVDHPNIVRLIDVDNGDLLL